MIINRNVKRTVTGRRVIGTFKYHTDDCTITIERLEFGTDFGFLVTHQLDGETEKQSFPDYTPAMKLFNEWVQGELDSMM